LASYFSRPLGADTTLDFLVARTPEGLRRAMLRNNLKHKAFINYMTPQYVKKGGEDEGRWYVWFFVSEMEKDNRGGE
jgi:hypothetical protein